MRVLRRLCSDFLDASYLSDLAWLLSDGKFFLSNVLKLCPEIFDKGKLNVDLIQAVQNNS